VPGDARAARLLTLLLLLQARGRMTAPETAAELGVSVRTVYRDVDALLAAGIPIWSEQGRTGGYRLVEGYRSRLTAMTGAEVDALALAGIPAAAAALGTTETTTTAERKLLAALAPDQRERAGRLRDRFHLDVPSWYADADEPPHLAALADAVLHERRVVVTYRRWTEPRRVERTLEPHGLVLKAGTWYVVARTAENPDQRTYRVSNVLALTPTDERFTRARDFALAERWAAHLAELDERRITAAATVRVSAALRERLPDNPSHPLAAAVRAAGDDTAEVITLPIESIGRAAADLIVFGAEVEVLDPPELRTALGELAAEVSALYARRAAP
jgi:predicted DNA-binding transcriptional regulator YafY